MCRCAFYYSLFLIYAHEIHRMKINKKKYDSDFFTRQRFEDLILCTRKYSVGSCVCIQYVYAMMYKNSKQESTNVGKYVFVSCHFFISLSLTLTLSNFFYPPKSQQTSILSFFVRRQYDRSSVPYKKKLI